VILSFPQVVCLRDVEVNMAAAKKMATARKTPARKIAKVMARRTPSKSRKS
jgi:hypothetical protein